jgi:hypothetical protein
MLQKLSKERASAFAMRTALNPSAIQDYLEMEQRWLDVAHSYIY